MECYFCNSVLKYYTTHAIHGNITRIDNVLDSFADKLSIVQSELENTKTQLENAKTELAAPFAKEAELEEKTSRLNELNILLNMNETDRSAVDEVPEDVEMQRNKIRER